MSANCSVSCHARKISKTSQNNKLFVFLHSIGQLPHRSVKIPFAWTLPDYPFQSTEVLKRVSRMMINKQMEIVVKHKLSKNCLYFQQQ